MSEQTDVLTDFDLRDAEMALHTLEDEKFPTSADAVRKLIANYRRLRDERKDLAKFKTYVHQRLDEAGIPADPESPHKAQGCRIGGRLDIVLRDHGGGWADALLDRPSDGVDVPLLCLDPWFKNHFSDYGHWDGQGWRSDVYHSPRSHVLMWYRLPAAPLPTALPPSPAAEAKEGQAPKEVT